MSDFKLIETMRFERGTGIVRLRLHLERLKRSANRLGFAGAERAQAALAEALGMPFDLVFAEGLPPSVGQADISPTRGEINPGRSYRTPDRSTSPNRPTSPKPASEHKGAAPISPLVGEMSDRTEGGEPSANPTLAISYPLRVRLTLASDGTIDITTAPFTPLAPDTVWRLKIARTRLASTDTLLRVKTTRRAVYEAARAEFSPAEADEVILLNETGAVCEGTITSIFLDDGSGLLKTPPISCGLLAGVLRTELICERRARIQRLSLADLANGRIFVGNSLRGLIPAVLVGES